MSFWNFPFHTPYSPNSLLCRKSGFSAVGYAAFRPTYPAKVFSTVLAYHHGPRSSLLDLGCGHGLISRELSQQFKTVLGTDPSSSMIAQAKSISSTYKNVSFEIGSCEDLSDIQDGSLDMVVSGQAAHWFDYGKAWPELRRKVRRGGTLAFWGYKDNIFVDYPKASKILLEYCYAGHFMGPFWEQPGRNILRERYRAIVPPTEDWEDVERIEYEPGVKGKGSGEGKLLMEKRLSLGEMEGYARTFSSYHDWMSAHEGIKSRKDGGEGDIVDVMFDEMLEAEPEWKAEGDHWRDFEVESEWGSVILLARRR